MSWRFLRLVRGRRLLKRLLTMLVPARPAPKSREREAMRCSSILQPHLVREASELISRQKLASTCARRGGALMWSCGAAGFVHGGGRFAGGEHGGGNSSGGVQQSGRPHPGE